MTLYDIDMLYFLESYETMPYILDNPGSPMTFPLNLSDLTDAVAIPASEVKTSYLPSVLDENKIHVGGGRDVG